MAAPTAAPPSRRPERPGCPAGAMAMPVPVTGRTA
jgi:hypothetical protein